MTGIHKKLSVIMPFLNEGQEPVRTVESIYSTCDPNAVEIIAIDDASDRVRTDFSAYPEVRCFRNEYRYGVAACRDQGVGYATTANILIIDGHMRFRQDNWLDYLVAALDVQPKTLFCTTSTALSPDMMDMNRATVRYYGANIQLILPDESNSTLARQILEPKWADEKPENEYEIPCVLGANYAIKKQWYQHLRGLEGLRLWGGDEVFLSLKSWMAGGNCKILKNIEIGHMYRNEAPYYTEYFHLYFNKMWICKLLFNQELAQALIAYFPNNHLRDQAFRYFDKNQALFAANQQHLSSVLVRPIEDVARLIGLDLSIN